MDFNINFFRVIGVRKIYFNYGNILFGNIYFFNWFNSFVCGFIWMVLFFGVNNLFSFKNVFFYVVVVRWKG